MDTEGIDVNHIETHDPSQPTDDKTKIRLITFGLALVVVLVVIILLALRSPGDTGSKIADAEASTRLEQAVDSCKPYEGDTPRGIPYDNYITTGDAGRSLSMSTEGTESSGATLTDVVCVLALLQTPEAVISRMGQTRALDGMQEATWDGLRGWWTYHPDAGFNIVIEDEES